MTLSTLSRLALATALLCLMLLALRIQGAMSLSEPLQLITSGDEQSSLFAMWKYAHGQPVYHDRFQIPYDALMYNWAFYELYGAFTKAALALTGLSDAWIPTLSRLVSLLAVATAAAAATLLFRRVLGAAAGARSLALAFGLVIAAGPLMGFWAITVRSDPWAFALDVVSITAFLTLWPNSRWRAVAAFGVVAYLAWSFKQSCIFSLGAVGLLLLIRREWLKAAALAVLPPAAWAATVALGSPQYQANMLFNKYPFDFSLSHGLGVLANMVTKSTPSLLLLAAAMLATLADRRLRQGVLKDDRILLGLLGVMVAGGLAFAGSMQTGSAENYHFTTSFYLALLALALTGRLLALRAASIPKVLAAAGLGWGLLAAAVLLALSGKVGVTDNHPQHIHNITAKACLDPLPRPLFVDDTYMSLPWMTPGTTPFVLSYTYAKERGLGHEFERGGVGSLIRAGEFATLIFPQGETSFDGVVPDGYALTQTCSGWDIYRRR